MRPIRHAIRLLGLLAVVLLPQSLHAQTATTSSTPYELFVTFGDSLADTGNVYTMTRALGFSPAVPPSDEPHRTYFQGRFSNGPVAFEQLWAALRPDAAPLTPFLRLGTVPRKGAVDFAFGGSTSGYVSTTPGGFYVPGLLAQVDLYLLLKRGSLPANNLFAIVTGSNDYLTTPPEPPADPQLVVGNIVRAVDRLRRAGARTVIVLNVIDLGTVPILAGEAPEVRAGLSALSTLHNQLLAGALAELGARHPALRIVLVDVKGLVEQMNDFDFGLPAIDRLVPPPTWPYPFPASTCLFVDVGTCPSVPTFDATFGGVPAFWWDAVHPGTAAHQRLAAYLATQVP